MYNYFVLIIGYLKFKQRNSMKNLYILQTDKPNPNILLKKDDGTLQIFDTDIYNMWEFHQQFGDFSPRNATYQNIYITSDEEIKEGDWCINIYRDKNEIFKNINLESTKFVKKIILTTDQNLIKDGVQTIPDEFLEWFVKNPSCEEVEIILNDWQKYAANQSMMKPKYTKYNIIIPKEEFKVIECYFTPRKDTSSATICSNCGQEKFLHTIGEGIKVSTYIVNTKEEPEQETVEEAAEQFEYTNGIYGFKAGAKWQQERMYNEKEVFELLNAFNKHTLKLQELKLGNSFSVTDWFEQFKKK